MFKPHCSSACALAIGRLRPLALSVSLAISAGAFPTLGYANESRSFQVQSGTLDQAITAFGQQSGVLVSVSGNVSLNKQTAGLVGEYTPFGGLTELLKGTGLRAIPNHDGSFTIAAPQSAETSSNDIALDPLTIVDDGYTPTRDEQGANAVYDKNQSTSFIGKAEVERYKGTAASDLLQGVTGVFSGEARNSGALDVNIRGIQGTGRVPVAIDGTEQALTVWRGYNGATNRNYIDPNLIGNIQIYKGAGVVRDVNTSTGGAMVVNTLNADDIIKPGEDFGIEVKVEGSSNSVSERIPSLHTGEDYREVDGYPSVPTAAISDETLIIRPDSNSGSYNVFSGEDYAYRLAVAKKNEWVDVLAAYAYRERGNYYSGKNNVDYYDQPQGSTGRDYITSMAQFWEPGSEVLNTSSKMESWLFKATAHLSEDEDLEFGYRDSQSAYGEIMPSRISRLSRGTVQWPLSKVDAKAYNLKYTLNPINNRFLDFHASLWRTDTDSQTYTRGGYPNYADFTDPILRNTAVTQADNTREGVTLSNKINLTDSLDLTLGSKFEHEQLISDDNGAQGDGSLMFPREGRRQQWEFDFDTSWRPTTYLELNAGMRYTSFWAFDDYLADHEGEIITSKLERYDVTYTVTRDFSQDEIDAWVSDELEEWVINYQSYIENGTITVEYLENYLYGLAPTSESIDTTVAWEPDSNGNYDRSENVCLNGSLEGQNVTQCNISAVNTQEVAKSERKKDHGWVPHLGATLKINDYNRIYFRYAEDLRYPSLFESTLGFSSSVSQYDLKPEHNHMWEIAYVSDLTKWLTNAEYADFKLAYYNSVTRDVIDRDNNFKFDNIDKQTVRGIELTTRYDTGRFFTDLGVNYVLENQVCDESTAAALSVNSVSVAQQYPISECMKYGFPSSYLLTQATPDLSANLNIGGRFFDRKLELGSRITYYRKYKNSDLEWYESHSASSSGTSGYVYFFNIPFSWGNTTLVDAYAKYKVNENFMVELVGTNLTNQYYVDPATRSAMAAPGRTVKLSLTGKF